MKKGFSIFSLCLVMLLGFSSLSYAEFKSEGVVHAMGIKLILDGKMIETKEMILEKGRSYLLADTLNQLLGINSQIAKVVYKEKEYLPLRKAAEQAGYTLTWDGKTKTISITKAQTAHADLNIGDKISGFVVKSIEDMPEVKGKAILFEHEKSGGELLYMANGSQNRTFGITFKTPALNDKGLPHVLEHTLISGTQKYPDPNIFFAILNRGYTTDLNAFTVDNHTSYPLSTLSEKQLTTLMDFYLSGVFDPLLRTEPNMFNREAWRYELTSKDAPIKLTGTVYNEMRGSLTFESVATTNIKKAAFDGGKCNYEAGGIPSVILEMTHEEVLEYHDTYYHPSNALIQLYGDIDYKKFLADIDKNYLSKYDKKNVYVEKGETKPYTETKYFDFEYPAVAGSEEKCAINYTFVLDNATAEEAVKFDALTKLFNSGSNYFNQEFKANFPNAQAYTSMSLTYADPTLTFHLANAKKTDRDAFVRTVDGLIARFVNEGFPKETMNIFWENQKLNDDLLITDSKFGKTTVDDNSDYWAQFGEANYLGVKAKAYKGLNQNVLQDLVKEKLIANPYRAVSTTISVPGKMEEENAKINQKLTDYKAKLKEDELDALVKQTKDFNAWSTTPVKEDVLAKLLNVRPADLEIKKPEFPINDEVIDGVRYLTTDIGFDEISNTEILIDLKDIPVDKLLDVKLYCNLIGSVPTTKYSRDELMKNVQKFASHADMGLRFTSAKDPKDDQYRYFISWTGLNSNYGETLAFIKELLFEGKFDDMDAIKEMIDMSMYSVKSGLDSDPEKTQNILSKAAFYDVKAVENYTSTDIYYKYLVEMKALAQSKPAELTKRLEEAKAIVLNKHNAVVCFVGGSENMKLMKKEIPALFKGMKKEQREKVDYSALKLAFKGEGVVNEIDVHNNYLFIGNLREGEVTGTVPVLGKFLSDLYLLPELRSSRGAYSAWMDFYANGLALASYKDPNIRETFEYYKGIPNFLKTADIKQETVDGYIISSFPEKSIWQHPFVTYQKLQKDYLAGQTIADVIKELEELKATTVSDIRGYAPVFEKMLKEGVKTSSGKKEVLEKSGLFEKYLEYK